MSGQVMVNPEGVCGLCRRTLEGRNGRSAQAAARARLERLR